MTTISRWGWAHFAGSRAQRSTIAKSWSDHPATVSSSWIVLAQRVQRHASPQTHSHARITTLFFALPCAPVGCVHSLPTPPLCSVFPSSILMMYLSTHHVHTEVPHWPDESLCEVESCCQPEAHACLIPIVSGRLGLPPTLNNQVLHKLAQSRFGSTNSVSARTTSTWACMLRSAVRGKSQPSPSTRLLARRSSSMRCPMQHRSPRHLVGWTRMRM